MQSASDNFVRAATGMNVLWAPSKVMVDWAADGYTATRTPGSTLFVRDNYSRAASGSWGTSDSGHTWTSSGGSIPDFNVSSTTGMGTVLHSATNVPKYLLVGQSILDSDQTVTYQSSALAVGATHSLSLLSRYVDTSNHFRVTAGFMAGTLVSLSIEQVVAGVVTTLATTNLSETVDTLVHAADKPFNIRAQICGTTIRAKIWSYERSEPGAWNLTTTSSALSAAGQTGIRTIVNTGGTMPITFSVDEYRMVNGEIDDISDQIGIPILVQHSLTNDLPREVASFISGVGTATASLQLAYGRGGMTAGQYFSPFRTDSPLVRYPRDVAPATIDVGVVTDGGIERIRIFTGQSLNTPVQGTSATQDLMSATRLRLSEVVQPPGILASDYGLNASWAISFLLSLCGVYVSPPPLTGCRWWVPMHGSAAPFSPDMRDTFPGMAIGFTNYEQVLTPVRVAPTFVADAPYLMGIFGEVTSARTVRATYNPAQLSLDAGYELFDQSGNTGRVEFWVRADASNFNGSPSGSGGISRTAGIEILDLDGYGSNTYVRAGVDALRQVRIQVYDGTGTFTLTHSTVLPTDGAWHFVGAAWTVSGDKLWINLDGVVQTSTPAMTTATIPPLTGQYQMNWVSYLPVSDIQVTAGAQANPDSGGAWANVRSFTPATVLPSALELTALAEPSPDEVWEIISRFAAAELATMRTAEDDSFQYLPLAHWAREEQQTQVDTITTRQHASELKVSLDPIQIRNTVRVNYRDGTLTEDFIGTHAPDYPANRVRAGGVSEYTVVFDRPSVVTARGTFPNAYTDTELGDPPVVPRGSYFTATTESDGTGSYASTADMLGQVLEWHPGAARVQIINFSAVDYYIGNGIGVPPLAIFGKYVNGGTASVTASNDNSVAERGKRGLTLDLPAIQTEAGATWVARHLANLLAQPRPRVESASVFADPRRQPGDLVAVADSDNTGATGLWRITSVEHVKSGPDYTQKVDLAVACLRGHWGDGVSRWGRNTVWSRGA